MDETREQDINEKIHISNVLNKILVIVKKEKKKVEKVMCNFTCILFKLDKNKEC
jgi:hypothetical protein